MISGNMGPGMLGMAPGVGAGRGAEGATGDWSCGSCHNLNYHFRDKCNRCHQARGAIQPSPQHQQQQQQAAAAMLYAGMQGGMPGANQGLDNGNAYGGWDAYQQGHVQQDQGFGVAQSQAYGGQNTFAFAQQQYGMVGMNPALAPYGAMQMHPQVAGGVAASSGSNGAEWICTSCQNRNYSFRTKCNRCQAVKA